MWMECSHLSYRRCFECAGTGRRGAKLSGKKICRNCNGSGKIAECANTQYHCMHCPNHPDLKKEVPR